MVWVTVRSLLARWWRAALTSLAAVVGIGVIAGTFIVGDTAERLGAGGDGDDVDFIRQIMLVAGAVALLVGAFIVNITISVTVVQRTRELAMLRCLGAETRQVRRSVLLEALFIGALSAAGGLVVGLGVATALRALINSDWLDGELPGHTLVVGPRTVLTALLVGCLVTVLSALAPARRAGRVPPIAALHDLPPPGSRRRTAARLAVGTVVTAAGLGSVPVAVGTGVGYLLIPGAGVTLVGLRLIGPPVAARLALLLGLPVERALRLPGELGRRNAVRNPDRTAATASALMIGIGLVSMLAVLGTSTKAYIVDQVARTKADFEVFTQLPPGADTGKPPPGGLSATTISRLRALPELGAVVPVLGAGDGTVPGERSPVQAVDPALLPQVVDLDVRQGDLAGLGAGGLGVTDEIAAAHGWTVGSPVPVRLPGGSRTFRVTAVYGHDDSYLEFLPDLLIDAAAYQQLGGDPTPQQIFARAAAGVAIPTARAAINRALAGTTLIAVEERSADAQRDLDMIDRAMRVYLVLTGLATLVGLTGIVNVLALSIVERRRELGLLRAVGMDPGQVRTMIRAEALIMAAVGAVLGLGLGLVFGWGGVQVLKRSSSPTLFTVPVGTLAVVVVAVAVAGLLAAALPARSAGRVDVLRAIGAE